MLYPYIIISQNLYLLLYLVTETCKNMAEIDINN